MGDEDKRGGSKENHLSCKQIASTGLASSPPDTQAQTSSVSTWPWQEIYWSFTASLAFLCTGLLRAYTSPALLSLQTDKQSVSLLSSHSLSRKDLISWIASSAPLASFLGTILSGPCLLWLGRRQTLTLLTVPCILGWLLIWNASSFWAILVGRGLTGLASGLATATAPLYITEVNAPCKIRVCLGLLPGIMLAAGMVLGFVLAHQFQNWRILALAISLFPGLLFILSLTIPESTVWLDMGKKKDAKCDLEMEYVADTSKDQNVTSEKTKLIPKHGENFFFSRDFYIPVGISVMLMLFQQFSGGNVIIYYLSEILTKSSGHGPTHLSQSSTPDASNTIHQSSLLIGVVQFLGFFLALPLVDKVGRRSLLITSALLMSVAHLVLGFHYHHLHAEQPVSDFRGHYVNYGDSEDFNDWLLLRVCSLCALLSCYSIGLGPIPFLYVEMIPCDVGEKSNTPRMRSYLASISSLVNHFTLFVVVKGFPYAFLERADITFWTFAVICWTAALFTFCFVPKTNEKASEK